MGALNSFIWFRGNPSAEQAAGRNVEEAVEAEAAASALEEEREEAGVAICQGGHKRKAGPGGPLAKNPRLQRPSDEFKSIYQAVVLRGEDSDIKIIAFGEEWNLHKVYLCRSGYFASMFSGSWRETNMDAVEIQMPDRHIDRESFHEVLGYLYCRHMVIPPFRVIAILATASMLQLDELIRQCEEIMLVSVSFQTVCSYYYSAENYGLQSVKSICHQWLLDNLIIQHNTELLLEVNVNLMKELVASSELLVIEVEMDLYTLLKKWMFLQLEPTWQGSQRALLSAANSWFTRYNSDSDGTPFLETDLGRTFVPVFQKLRFPYTICDLPSAHIMDQDALIPATWLTPVYKEQWRTLLQAEQSRELEPMDIYVSDPQGKSMRCGGRLRADEQCSWTWAGFIFGWDLIVCYVNRRIIFRRSAMNKSCGFGVSSLWQRKIAFRLRLISLDGTGRAVFRKDTDYQVLSLRKDQELEVVNLENQDLVFPMYVSCNFLYISGNSGTSQSGDSGTSLEN